MPVNQGQRLDAILAGMGKTYETHFYPGLEHYFELENPAPGTMDMFWVTVNFFKKGL